MWRIQEEGAQEASRCAQRRACVRTIAIGGLDSDEDVRIALSERLNVVVSTNTNAT